MFAVIKTGGKQYRVSEGSLFRAEKVEGEKGQVVELDQVMMVDRDGAVTLGQPTVTGAKVLVEIVDQIRDKKVLIFKKIRRHNYRRKKGHRQMLSILRVKEIVAA